MTYFVPFLLDLFPLLVFVILDSLGKMRYALIGAIAAAGFELMYTYMTIGYLDSFSLVFASFILVFAAISLYFNNPIFFRLKPALIGSITGLILIITSVMDKPALLAMADHYSTLLPEEMKRVLENRSARAQLKRANGVIGLGLIFHALFTTWIAIKSGRWVWFFVSVPGLYVTIALCVWASI